MARTFFIALAAAFALSACGGSSTSRIPDTAVIGDMPIYGQGGIYRARSSCDGSTCVLKFLGESITLDMRDIEPGGPESDITSSETRNGVSIGWFTETAEGMTFTGYGAWAEHQAFVAAETFSVEDGVRFAAIVPMSMGFGSGSSPTSGSAVWKGAMLGMKVDLRSPGNSVIGDATLTADIADGSLNVSFTNIEERLPDGSAALDTVPDMHWSDLAIHPGGSFGSFRGRGIEGRFYGPDHEEAGGVFDKEGRIVGAFGARRQ